MSRWKAAGIHLLFSAAIAAAVLILMLAVWYPWPLVEIAGGSRLAFILAAVNVVAGPLITLLVYKQGKQGMKFDLVFIAVLQFAALAYGIHALYLARPVYLVFTIDRFDLVTAKDLDPADLAKVTRPEFQKIGLGRARYIAVQAPQDADERLKVTMTALSGKDLQMYPQYYVPYSEEAGNALGKSQPLDTLLARDKAATEAFLARSGRPAESLRYLPLRGRDEDAAVLLDAASGNPIAMLLVDPW
jgi:hypothetical protein